MLYYMVLHVNVNLGIYVKKDSLLQLLHLILAIATFKARVQSD